jgi:hypothetical protein
LQCLYAFVELHDEGLIFALAEHLIEKCSAGSALLPEHAFLTAAGIHQKPHGKRKVGLPGEVAAALRDTVLFEDEVVRVQIFDDAPVLIVNRCQKRYDIHVDGEGGHILSAQPGGQDEYQNRECRFHSSYETVRSF